MMHAKIHYKHTHTKVTTMCIALTHTSLLVHLKHSHPHTLTSLPTSHPHTPHPHLSPNLTHTSTHNSHLSPNLTPSHPHLSPNLTPSPLTSLPTSHPHLSHTLTPSHPHTHPLPRESDITKERIKKILDAGANVILCTGGIDDLCLKYFVEAGAMAVRRVKKEDLKRIARATGG